MQAIKKGIASLLGISQPTALARPPATPTAVTARPYISFRAMQALKEAPVGQAGLQAFRIQRHGECVQSSHDVKTSMIRHLLQDGTMARNEPPQSFWGRLVRMMSWPQGELVPYEGPWTPLHRLSRQDFEAASHACALAEQEVPEVLITQDDLTRHIFYDSTVHVSRPLLPPKVCDELAAAIRAEPALIEQFT